VIPTLSPLALSTARSLGIPEPVVKRARQRPFREHQEPAFLAVYSELEDGRTLRMRCCHHDPGQIVSLGLA
jgi:hypothetical protein